MRICPSIVVLVSLVARRVWSARVAEREPRLAAHAELVFCEQSIDLAHSSGADFIVSYDRAVRDAADELGFVAVPPEDLLAILRQE